MAHPEAVRNIKPVTRGRRIQDVRRLNYGELPPEYAFAAWTDGGADLDVEGSSAWGDKELVDNYERLHLHLDFTHGGNITTVFVAMQVSPTGGEDSSQWYDVYEDEAETGVLARKIFEVGATGDVRIAWPDALRVSRYVRFKVWVDGTTYTGSRATLRASRVMDSL